MIAIKFNNWDKYNKRQKDIKRPFWFALSNDFFVDPHLHDFSDQERLTLIYLLCEASKQNKYGEVLVSEPIFKRYTGFSTQVLLKTVDKLLKSKAAAEWRQDGGGITTATGQDRTEQTTYVNGVADDGIGEVAEQVGPSPSDLVELWNEVKHPALGAVKDLTEKRRKRATKILKKYPAIETWQEVFTKLNASKFCTGQVKPSGDRTKPWKATFDWLLSEDSIAKILEGAYDK